MNNNDYFFKRANKFIPGGAHTYSKGYDQFPSNAPGIIKKGLGCKLWDMEGNVYTDMAMSLGTTVLGHAYKPVLDAVRNELSKGVNFCKPSHLEGELAELLVNTIPGTDMVKLGKHGSDAVTASIKIARAFTGRNIVARCSDDPFNAVHDWFIGSTVVNRGVPEEVINLTKKFKYNDIESCENLFNEFPNQIACFLLEPLSFIPQNNCNCFKNSINSNNCKEKCYDNHDQNFLIQLKKLCEKNGALLIFDEVVSGFRFSLGGAQELIGVTPHLSAFGKAMANGFSVSALVGKEEFMKLAGINHDEERVFLLSTTHGGETHSIAAAIACINEIKDKNIISHFWEIGRLLMSGIRKVSKELNCEHLINVSGYSVKPAISFNDENGNISSISRTLFLQEMIKQNVLMPYVVPSYAHKKEDIDHVVNCIGNSLEIMDKASKNGGMKKYIEGDVIKPVFRKYN